ncbi:MAG: hypothetical protein ACRDGG_11200 [Anaerolineae bacterium]
MTQQRLDHLGSDDSAYTRSTGSVPLGRINSHESSASRYFTLSRLLTARTVVPTIGAGSLPASRATMSFFDTGRFSRRSRRA